MKAFLFAAAMAAIASCATAHEAQGDAAAAAPAYTVIEENAVIPFGGATITGFEVADDGHSVLFTGGPSRWYRATVWESCARDLRRFEDTIAFSPRGNQVDRYTTLYVNGRSCPIETLDRIERPAPAPAG